LQSPLSLQSPGSGRNLQVSTSANVAGSPEVSHIVRGRCPPLDGMHSHFEDDLTFRLIRVPADRPPFPLAFPLRARELCALIRGGRLSCVDRTFSSSPTAPSRWQVVKPPPSFGRIAIDFRAHSTAWRKGLSQAENRQWERWGFFEISLTESHLVSFFGQPRRAGFLGAL
jgi:hypothetical protein